MAQVRVKYTGRGGEIFPSLGWQPKRGDEIEIEESLIDPRRMKVVEKTVDKEESKS